MFDVDKIRKEFPILDTQVYGKPLVYLDSAATAQKPRQVIDKVNFLHESLNANIHRGVHFLSEQTTEEYERARERVRTYINAAQSSEIIFTSGATASINLVAYSFGERFVGRGDNVIVSEMEHHSNIVPWQILCERRGAELRVLPFDEQGELRVDMLEELIDGNSRLVAVTQASNVLGTCPPLDDIIRIAHGADVPVLVDGCQGIVHDKVDVTALECDFYAFSGHKLYAPTGIGVLYGKKEYLEQMPPFMGGGDMVGTVSFKHTTYAELPLKFEAGTSNYIGAIGLGEAIAFLERFDHKEIMAHERMLLDYATEQLSARRDIKIYGTVPSKCSIVSFTAQGTHPYDIGMILDKQGVAIRTGTHCAEPVMQHYGLTGMCRASMAMYNTKQEIDEFVIALDRALKMLK